MDSVKVALGNRGMTVETARIHDAVGINCKKRVTTENKDSAVKYMG